VWDLDGWVQPDHAGRTQRKRIGIERIGDQVLEQALPVVTDQVENRPWTGAVVEKTGAYADHGLLDLSRSICNRSPWRKIVVVVEIVLPVVSQTEGDLQVGAHAKLILKEPAQELFNEHDVPVTGLPEQRKGMMLLVVFERRECVRTAEVGM